MIAKNPVISPKSRFMLLDVIDLRLRSWKASQGVAAPHERPGTFSVSMADLLARPTQSIMSNAQIPESPLSQTLINLPNADKEVEQGCWYW